MASTTPTETRPASPPPAPAVASGAEAAAGSAAAPAPAAAAAGSGAGGGAGASESTTAAAATSSSSSSSSSSSGGDKGASESSQDARSMGLKKLSTRAQSLAKGVVAKWQRLTWMTTSTTTTPSGPIGKLFENNQRWAAEHLQRDPEYFKRVDKRQAPDYLWIGCADSRVPAASLLGLEVGELFVHRNVANLVVNSDMNVLAVIEYAVEHLKVKDIIICGHYGCGGVKAAMGSKHLGALDHWLANIRDVYRQHAGELAKIKDEEQRHRRLVELNVGEQCMNILKLYSVQRQRKENNLPRVHGVVYDLSSGLLHKVKIRFDTYQHMYGDIYNITD